MNTKMDPELGTAQGTALLVVERGRGGTSPTDNQRIGGEILRRLEMSPYPQLRRVEVRVDGTEIVLRGAVPSYFIKQLAQETSREAGEGRKIQNELVVR